MNATERRYFKGDKWTRYCGSCIPLGAEVNIVRVFARRKTLVEYQGKPVVTMLWCLSKKPFMPQERSRAERI